MSDSQSSPNESKTSATNLFRALNPALDSENLELLETSLNRVDNALFTLLVTSDWEIYEINDDATKKLFKCIQAGLALKNVMVSDETPIQQRAAVKILVRSLHVNIEKELRRFPEYQT